MRCRPSATRASPSTPRRSASARGSRDIVLIDAPGHAEFLRNMITGASQADGAVLIIDALEGVRDQTRRHGYLLHLLGVKQVAVVVNKMDRVDFSAARFDEISDEISAHLDRPRRHAGGGDPDFGARRRRRRRAHARGSSWYAGPTVVEALDALEPARPLETLALRLPVQAIYKFDDRRIVAGRIESGSLAAGDEIVIMPAGKIAKIRSVESWPVTPLDGAPERGPLGRHHARPRAVRRARRHHRPCRRQPARHAPAARAHLLAARQAARRRATSILVRLGTRETRATVVAIEKAVDPGELASVETTSIARNHVGEIDISLAQPIAADPYADNPRTGRLVIEVNGRIAGGGLVLSVDAGQRAVPVDIVPVESALRARRTLGALSPQRRGGLADRPAGLRKIDPGARAGTPAVRQWRLAGAARRRHAARRAQQRSRFLRRRPQPRTSAASPKSPLISPATAISPSSPRSRPRARTAPRRAASPTPRSAKSMSRPRPKCARAAIPRATTPRRAPARCRRFTGIGSDYQPPPACELTHRHLDALGSGGHRGDRADAGEAPASCSTNSSTSPPISEPFRQPLSMGNPARQRPSHGPGFRR